MADTNEAGGEAGPTTEEETGSQTGRDGTRKQKEFFKEELKRLQTALLEEKDKIIPPPVKEHVPYTFNTLEPYYNCHTAEFLISTEDEEAPPPEPCHPNFVSRQTALGMCDPWVAHRMDVELEPKPSPRPGAPPAGDKGKKQKDDSRPPKEGSTRLPKFPAVSMSREGIKKDLKYSDVPELREQLRAKVSSDATDRLNEDYQRTKQDFYRMELDRLQDVHPINRPNMRKAYFAYLQNTPGSKRAVNECVKAAEKAS